MKTFLESLDGLYVVWSNEHSAWWRPYSQGYCSEMMGAGLYTKEEADKICEPLGGRRDEVAYPAVDVWASFAHGINRASLLGRFIQEREIEDHCTRLFASSGDTTPAKLDEDSR